jgi:hypothetical protein
LIRASRSIDNPKICRFYQQLLRKLENQIRESIEGFKSKALQFINKIKSKNCVHTIKNAGFLGGNLTQE